TGGHPGGMKSPPVRLSPAGPGRHHTTQAHITGGTGAMQLNSPSDLFVYELSAMYDAEAKSAQLFGEVIGQIQDPNLAQFVRAQEEQSQQKVQNIEECFSALDTQREDVACLAVDGMRADFQAF